MSEREQNLCAAIIREHFGEIAENVCSTLVQKGRQNLGSIVTATKLPVRQVRESLFILVQHHCVRYANTAEGSRMIFHYLAQIPEILQRDRFPLFVRIAEERFGELGAICVRELLYHGRLNFPTLCENAKSNTTKASSTSFLSDLDMEDVFTQMVEERFIIRTEYTDAVSDVDKILQEEAEAIAKSSTPLTPQEVAKLRKKLAADRQASYDEKQSTGSKRKIVYDFEEGPRQKAKEDTVGETKYFRVNYERFLLHCRTESMAELATIRINPSAGEIIRQMMRHCEAKLRGCQIEEKSVPITQTLLSTLINKNISLNVEGAYMNSALTEYMETLTVTDVPFLSKDDLRGGGLYTVNILFIAVTNYMRMRLITSVIQEKFGTVALRIWRLLHTKGKLDERQIAKLSMVPVKLAREALYNLLNSHLVILQDVPKTADHSAARTFFLWGVSVTQSVETLTAECYKILTNLKHRRIKELEKRATLREKLQREDVKENPDLLSAHDKQNVEEMNRVMHMIKASEQRIDKMVMTLRDF
ncbi:DNA-directed RNA polymerase III subunit RPC3 [Quaeritorhiza haematococci]|nr:DNA-directed RNA polymerase III subunit RPC3 [Quaeritorhiza haematococci]